MNVERNQPQTIQRASQNFASRMQKFREEYWQKACKVKPDRPACKVYEN